MQKIKNKVENKSIKNIDNNQKLDIEKTETQEAKFDDLTRKGILSGLDKKTYWYVIFLIIVTFGIFYFYLKHEVDKKLDMQKDKSTSNQEIIVESKEESIKDASNLKQSFNIPFDVNLFVSHFGGSENIVKVENSLSTIQVYVEKKELVKKESIKELLSGKGISTVEKKFSIVCGDFAESLKNEVVKILNDVNGKAKPDEQKTTEEKVELEKPIKGIISDKEEAEVSINKSEDSLISVKVDVTKIQKNKKKSTNVTKEKIETKSTGKKTIAKEVSKNVDSKEIPSEHNNKATDSKVKNDVIESVEFKQSKNIPFDIDKLITLFGGWVNIDKVENSSTSSIQIYVFDKTIVKKDEIKALMSAKGIMLSDKKYSIICGTYAADLKNDLQKIMEINKKSASNNVKMDVQIK